MVLNVAYNAIKPYAIDSNLVDTSGGYVYNVADPSESPYDAKSLFYATPYTDESYDSIVTFVLDSTLMLSNYPESWNYEIDVNDGQGYQSIQFGGTVSSSAMEDTVHLIKIRAFNDSDTNHSTFYFSNKVPVQDEPDGTIVLNAQNLWEGKQGKGRTYYRLADNNPGPGFCRPLIDRKQREAGDDRFVKNCSFKHPINISYIEYITQRN